MPHITMAYPFRPKKEFHVLAADLSGLCQDIEPFVIELAQFRFFGHSKKRYTLWLAPEPDSQLVDLQSKLLKIVPNCNEVNLFPGGFTPHLSVGQVRGRAKMENLLAELQQSWRPLSFVVREISLIWRSEPPDDVFRVARKVGLKY
jgi:2'-5' RNA ligase